MKIEKAIAIRKNLINFKVAGVYWRGSFSIKNAADLSLFSNIDDSFIKSLEDSQLNDVTTSDLEIGQSYSIRLIPSAFYKIGYFENCEEFYFRHELKNFESEYYIHDTPKDSGWLKAYLEKSKFMSLIDEMSSDSSDSRNYFIQSASKYCKVINDFDFKKIEAVQSNINFDLLRSEVTDQPDSNSRMRSLKNEVLLSAINNSIKASVLFSDFEEVVARYRNNHELYLSEFSFTQVKSSSHEYFHELTDRIHSTIHKFSTQIFTIPIAFVFVIRFLDFSGEQLVKNIFLIVLASFYMIIIQWVLLNNIKEGFHSIESDIDRFIGRIEDDKSLQVIVEDLKAKKEKLLPKQLIKVHVVEWVSWSILVLTFFLLIHIHLE